MSLLDLIFGQKIIIISIGVALLLILAAVFLAIVPRIRRSRKAKAQKRAAEQARLAAARALEAEDEVVGEVVKPAPAKGKAAAAVPAAATAKPAAKPAVPPAAPVGPKPAAPVVSAEQPKAPEAAGGAPNGVQDILSSVFADDGMSERAETLLRGMSDVEMADLLILAQNVKVQMHGGKTVTVVTSKELE